MKTETMMVSVYCLAYNHESYIRDCLQGFVDQKTDFRYEVFVHDDASPDGTAGIIREYAEKYPEIIKPILQEKNQYSQGIKIMATHIYPRMTGKYVAICEGDDFWNDPNKLQRQVDFLEAHPEYSACVHDSHVIDCRDGKKSRISILKEDTDVTFEDIALKWPDLFQTSSLMYRRELFERRPDFITKTKGFGDLPQAIYFSLCGKVWYMHDPMSTYRRFSLSSWSRRKSMGGTRADRHRFEKVHLERMVAMYEMIDSYTDGKRRAVIDQAIHKAYFDCEGAINPKGLLKKEYRDLYAQFPPIRKVKTLIKAAIQIVTNK